MAALHKLQTGQLNKQQTVYTIALYLCTNPITPTSKECQYQYHQTAFGQLALWYQHQSTFTCCAVQVLAGDEAPFH